MDLDEDGEAEGNGEGGEIEEEDQAVESKEPFPVEAPIVEGGGGSPARSAVRKKVVGGFPSKEKRKRVIRGRNASNIDLNMDDGPEELEPDSDKRIVEWEIDKPFWKVVREWATQPLDNTVDPPPASVLASVHLLREKLRLSRPHPMFPATSEGAEFCLEVLVEVSPHTDFDLPD